MVGRLYYCDRWQRIELTDVAIICKSLWRIKENLQHLIIPISRHAKLIIASLVQWQTCHACHGGCNTVSIFQCNRISRLDWRSCPKSSSHGNLRALAKFWLYLTLRKIWNFKTRIYGNFRVNYSLEHKAAFEQHISISDKSTIRLIMHLETPIDCTD